MQHFHGFFVTESLSDPVSIHLMRNARPLGQRDGLPHAPVLEHLDQTGRPAHFDIDRRITVPQPKGQPGTVC